MKWYVAYYKRYNWVDVKYVHASTAEEAVKKSRVKLIVELFPVDESGKRIEKEA